jgi:hypothetical protein
MHRTFAAIAGLIVAPLLLPGQSTSSLKSSKLYKAPRTPWGDPDLQGTWPAQFHIPMSRPADLPAASPLPCSTRFTTAATTLGDRMLGVVASEPAMEFLDLPSDHVEKLGGQARSRFAILFFHQDDSGFCYLSAIGGPAGG